MDKRKRQAAILELVGDETVGSQEELRLLLHKRGWDVTQSTLVTFSVSNRTSSYSVRLSPCRRLP